MLKKLLIGLVVLLAVSAVVVQLQPSEYKVERSTVIPAPPSAAFGLVNDFHRWKAWSPWEKLDPDMKRTYSGSEAGTGAKYAWVGNRQVGEGEMTIADSKPNESVVVDLHFVKPMAFNAVSEFKLVPEENATKVTWTMSGKKNFIQKGVFLVMNMDKTIGDKYEQGLANLKHAATGGAVPAGTWATGTATGSPTPAAHGH